LFASKKLLQQTSVFISEESIENWIHHGIEEAQTDCDKMKIKEIPNENKTIAFKKLRLYSTCTVSNRILQITLGRLEHYLLINRFNP